MKLQFLGTGAGLPSKFRNVQSFVFNFMQELKECWMFDCGEATQHKILETAIRPSKIKKIFISHMHGDHILGLIGFLSSRSFLMSEEKSDLILYGPVGIKEYVEMNLKATQTILGYKIEYVEFDKEEQIIENEKVTVKILPLIHSVQSYGFEIKFKDSKGSMLVEKIRKLGIQPGPFYKTIKEEDNFIFEGREYLSKDFLTKDKKGEKITIIPDTKYFEKLKRFVEGSDLVVSECTYLDKNDHSLAVRNKHMSIKDIETLLTENNVKKIFLTHISARYDKEIEKTAKKYIEQYCKVYIAKDLKEYDLKGE